MVVLLLTVTVSESSEHPLFGGYFWSLLKIQSPNRKLKVNKIQQLEIIRSMINFVNVK